MVGFFHKNIFAQTVANILKELNVRLSVDSHTSSLITVKCDALSIIWSNALLSSSSSNRRARVFCIRNIKSEICHQSLKLRRENVTKMLIQNLLYLFQFLQLRLSFFICYARRLSPFFDSTRQNFLNASERREKKSKSKLS